jgi:hypothetical protein
MAEQTSVPRWFPILVVLAVVAGIALAFWFYAAVGG